MQRIVSKIAVTRAKSQKFLEFEQNSRNEKLTIPYLDLHQFPRTIRGSKVFEGKPQVAKFNYYGFLMTPCKTFFLGYIFHRARMD